MNIKHLEISNFRALERLSLPIENFNMVIGENDVGKTSLLQSLNCFFEAKKLNDDLDWFKRDTSKPVRIVITFDATSVDELADYRHSTGDVIVSRVFEFGKAPESRFILEDQSAVAIPKAIADQWFSIERFHFIPVRRDLSVQFSMAKTALLGKLLRNRMKEKVAEVELSESIANIQKTLSEAISEPQAKLQSYLQEQMDNDQIILGFDNLQIDPVEGVTFDVSISDDRVKDIGVENRGAGTQNNLIIALFRLLAELGDGGNLILAMEEPENSLHPKAQRQLMTLIRSISTQYQVLVTTHSSVFIDRNKYQHNIIMTRTAAGNTIARNIQQVDAQ